MRSLARRTAIWLTFNIVAVVLIAGASEGRLFGFGLLRGWARVVIFAAALFIGFPEWVTTLIGGAVVAAVLALRGLARAPEPGIAAAGQFSRMLKCILNSSNVYSRLRTAKNITEQMRD